MNLPAPRHPNDAFIARFARAAGGWSVLARLALFFAVLAVFAFASPDFASAQNLYALCQSFALLGLVTLGLSLTMLAGEFDLGVGAMVAVAGLITLKTGEASAIAGIAGALTFGLAVGLVNAVICWWCRMSSLVVTVGTMMTLAGVAYWLAGGRVVSTDNFDAGLLLDDPIAGILSVRSIVTFVAALGAFLLVRFTRIGRDIIAIGSHRTAATASGARIGLSLAAVFCLSGACAALAGSLLALSLATASATMGGNLLLQAASAAILGGIALSGGVGNPLGVMIGVLVLVALNNGLSLLGTSASGILFTNGLVLLAAVLLDVRLAGGLRARLASARKQRPIKPTAVSNPA